MQIYSGLIGSLILGRARALCGIEGPLLNHEPHAIEQA